MSRIQGVLLEFGIRLYGKGSIYLVTIPEKPSAQDRKNSFMVLYIVCFRSLVSSALDNDCDRLEHTYCRIQGDSDSLYLWRTAMTSRVI